MGMLSWLRGSLFGRPSLPDTPCPDPEESGAADAVDDPLPAEHETATNSGLPTDAPSASDVEASSVGEHTTPVEESAPPQVVTDDASPVPPESPSPGTEDSACLGVTTAEHGAASDTAANPIAAGSDGPPDAEVEAWQERAAGRILEDERLRGDLTDDQFQPLLDWALSAADLAGAEAAAVRGESADALLDERMSRIKDVVGLGAEVVAAHAEEDSERRGSALKELADLLAASPERGWASSAATRQIADLATRLDGGTAISPEELAAALASALTPPSGEAVTANLDGRP